MVVKERVLEEFHVLGVFDVFTRERLAKTEKCHHSPELTHGNVNNSSRNRGQMMATLEVRFHDDSFEVISQVFCCTIHDTWENRKAWFVILRSVRSPTTGKPFFSYQCLATAFMYKARQNIHNYLHEYEACDESLFEFLRHKRKVDPVVVQAVREELGHDVLAKTGALCARVNQQLAREDLTAANIRVALDQIPCTVIRTTVFRELAAGTLHPKEEVVLAELFAAVEHHEGTGRASLTGALLCPVPTRVPPVMEVQRDAPGEQEATDRESVEVLRPAPSAPCPDSGKLARYAEIAAQAGLEALREAPDEAIVQRRQAAADGLLTPKLPLSEIPEPVAQMVTAMALYASGASFAQLGRWFGGKAKSTMYTWVIGLSLAIWPTVRGWIWSHVTGSRQSVDEKWIKIRKRWYYLFVSLDDASGLPMFHDLLPTRTKWACRLFMLKLKRLGLIPVAIITDGLQGYVSAITAVFPAAKHLLCVFHHQQGVTRCINTQFDERRQDEAKIAKKQMKQVVQTRDPRTVRRRLDQLENTANERHWSILEWITRTRKNLKHLVPALRSNTYPSTTNAIERFFRAFTQFYKTRCGFHSVSSAKREMIFFMVIYLFTIQVESGTAPIESILPEATTMPFYQLLNYPLACELSSQAPQNVKPAEDMAREVVDEVGSLP
jgi:transposase-like protein